MNRTTLLGYLYAALGAALFSTKAIFIKLAYQDKVDATLMLALRMIFSFPFFLVIGLYVLWQLSKSGKPLPQAKTWVAAAAMGFFGFSLSAWLDFAGLQYISAQLERLVLFTYPVMIMILGWLFFKGRITWMGSLGAAITYGGLVIVFLSADAMQGSNLYLGTGLVLACALVFAFYQLIGKRIIGDMGSVLFTCVSMVVAVIPCAAMYVIQSGDWAFQATPRFYWLAFGCGVFATVLPSFFVNASLSLITAQSQSMIAAISPLITIALAVSLLGEKFEWVDALGSVLVIIGIALYALTDVKPEAQRKQEMAGELEAV